MSVAGATDLHLIWEDRCTPCHGEAGDFARNFLGVTDGKLSGRQADRDLHLFLRNHYLGDNEVDAVYDMLFAQATSGVQFRAKCNPCHAKAAPLVRGSLARSGGVLYVRDSGRPLREFLYGHGGLEASEIPFFVNLLDRIEQEVHRP